MSVSHYVANSAKRQFYRPNQFANDWGGALLRDVAGHALAQLIGGWMKSPEQLGCWAGDPLFIIRDSGSDWSAQLWPDALPGATQDYDVLCSMYTDVTYPVMAGLGHRDDLAEEFVQRAGVNEIFFLALATVVAHYDVPTLQIRFLAAFGTDWRGRFERVWKLNFWWHPLPTPWSRLAGN